MTGWRCAAIVGNAEAIDAYWRLKTNIDSGMFEAVQLAGVAALSPDADATRREMNALYRRRRDLVVEALRADRRRGHAAQGHDLRLGAGSRGLSERRPRTASTCSRRPASWSRPAAPTGPTARASSASPSRRRTTG